MKRKAGFPINFLKHKTFMMARRLSPTVIQSDFCDKVLFIELNLVVGLGGRNSVLWVTHPTVTLDSLLKAKVSTTFFLNSLVK